MPLRAGDRIGQYEILAPIGEGAMGEVYRARDTVLKRDVALKVLPVAFAEDTDRMARFQREAELLASLNHPNIAHIYGVESGALVMELVEGNFPRGPLAFDDAWKIVSQVGAALEYAHDHGVIHRDLKPDNILVTHDGVVKVLDFGLAKALGDDADPLSIANRRTMTIGATMAGTIVGTAAYMAPEQARGKRVDQRADNWSWGVILYELLTGQALFAKDSAADTLAQVLTKDPDFEKVPARARRLLESCLEKDPKKRLRDVGDARFLLIEPGAVLQTAASRRRRLWAASIALAIAILGSAWVAFVGLRRQSSNAPSLRVSLLPPENAVYTSSNPAVSPDGRRVVFAAMAKDKTTLWIRDLDSLVPRPIEGTEDASFPFWSPDSRWIAFFTGRQLKKIQADSGPALTICDAIGGGRGGSWSTNGTILFGMIRGGLFRVPAAGGTPALLIEPDRAAGQNANRFPWFLPDGHHFLYTGTSAGAPEKSKIYLADLDAKPPGGHELLTINSNAEYAPPGYILYVRERTLVAQPFDAAAARLAGDPIPLADQVDLEMVTAHAQFSVSQDARASGVLVYTSGASFTSRIGIGRPVQFTWFDRSGKPAGTIGGPDYNRPPALSPDDKMVAFARGDPVVGGEDIWLYDIGRGAESRFTFGGSINGFPIWSPDGSRIAFESRRGGTEGIYAKAVGGVSEEEVLDSSPARPMHPDDWSPDGHYLIEETAAPEQGADVWLLPATGSTRKPTPYLNTRFNERDAKVSPNGRWLAYESDESGRQEIYVQTFPAKSGKWQVSSAGGASPVWSRDGRELFYVSPDSKMMEADVRSGADFQAGAPRALFDVPSILSFDVAKDGRFLLPIPVAEPPSATVPLTVLVNWAGALKN